MEDRQEQELQQAADLNLDNLTDVDMIPDDRDNELVTTIRNLIETKDLASLKKSLAAIEDVEIMFVMSELSRKEQSLVFRMLGKESALYVFEQLEIPLQKQLLEDLTDNYARLLIEDLDPDDRAGLMDEMPANVATRLMSLLSPEERAKTNLLMGYEPQTAGRIMTPEFISLRGDMTVAEALRKVRLQAKDKETIYTLYVTDSHKKLEGVVTLKELIIADPDIVIHDLMNDKVIKVSTNTDQESAASAMQEFDLLAMPVVDSEDRIVGIITIDDAIDILEQEATEDIYNKAGLADITGKETNRSEVLVRGNLLAVWKVRLPFLAITIIAGLVSGFIIGGFEDVLGAIPIVAMFIPLIMDMGGSVGNQSATIFVRGVALGHVDTKKFFKHLGREIGIGASIGVVVGGVTGTIAAIIGQVMSGEPMLGLAVGLALFVTIIIAAMLGFLIPFILIKLKKDQAAGSSPLVTAIKDMVALVVYFLLVSALMHGLLYGG